MCIVRLKRFIIVFILCNIFCVLISKCYALSNSFIFVIETIGIPRYNKYNEEINEDVYYAYNVFSYGNPASLTKGQRWKDSPYGYWTKGGGKYNGYGVRGEYELLGRSYNGAVISNYYFPMDVIPNTTPDKWIFYNYPGALESWDDTTKYKYNEQLLHMKESNLMFNDISSKSKADNPSYIREYNITANTIGLNKAKLDAAATWKTNGIISTRRKISGIIYSQVYLVKPIAATADVKTEINVKQSYILTKDMETLTIPIEYETSVINMTGNAKAEHIKEIKAELYIDDKKTDEISGSKITSVGNKYMLIITREHFPPNVNYNIKICVDGYMHTEFVVDGLMRDIKTTNINVYVEPKLVIPLKNNEILLLEKETNKWVVSPLAQTYITNAADSIGFAEAGKHLVAKLGFALDANLIKNVKIFLDNNEVPVIPIIYNKNRKKLHFEFLIPKDTEATLYGMYTLREKEGTYFNIDFKDIALRRLPPHILKITFEYNKEEYEQQVKIDTLDDYLTNINSNVKKSILNYDNFCSRKEFTKWLKE